MITNYVTIHRAPAHQHLYPVVEGDYWTGFDAAETGYYVEAGDVFVLTDTPGTRAFVQNHYARG